MSQWNIGPTKSFPSQVAMANRSRVILSGGLLVLAGVNDRELGVIEQATTVPTYGAATFNVPVRLRTSPGTEKMIANAAIAANGLCYAGPNGTVDATGTILIGVALQASSAQNDIIEVLRISTTVAPVSGVVGGLKVAYGQKTTVTAADTVATGLTTVLAVVASLESDPTDNPEWVTSQIGDQAGAPVAGSVIIKTWQNTAGNDPTPIAATTFGKKVNWIAIGN